MFSQTGKEQEKMKMNNFLRKVPVLHKALQKAVGFVLFLVLPRTVDT